MNILSREVILNDEGEPAGVPTDRLAEEMLSTIKDIKGAYYTDKGTIDYGALRVSAEYAAYKRLTAALRGYDPRLLKDPSQRLAFWINLYNTIVVDGIIGLKVKGSVKEVKGFFSRIKYRIGGLTFSPDDIEHGILRANSRPYMHVFRQFGPLDSRRELIFETIDPRIHFALVCGSRSCAPIKFYTAERIEADLEAAAVNFINSPEVIVTPGEKRLAVSMIFKWYGKDFGGRAGVVDFIRRYLVDEARKRFLEEERIRIEYQPYDWSLNA